MKEVLIELIEWKKGVVGLIISIEALESFIELRDVLMKTQRHKTPIQKLRLKIFHVELKNSESN